MSNYVKYWPAQAKKFRRGARSSLLLQAAALSMGTDTIRIGHQGFISRSPSRLAAVAFQGSVSSETSWAAVRVCADRLTRRVSLAQAKVPIPAARRFSRRDIEAAADYAARFARGVLVKPRSVETGPLMLTVLSTSEQVRAAIEDNVASGKRGTFLVERWLSGTEFSFYIVGDQIVSSVRRHERDWDEEVFRAGADGFGDMDPEVTAMALRAKDALPAMPHATVSIYFPSDAPSGTEGVVVSVSPQVQLLGAGIPAEWSVYMADCLVRFATRGFGDRATLPGPEPICVSFRASEVANSEAFTEDVIMWAGQNGCEIRAAPGDREVTGTIEGTVGALASMSGFAKAGVFGESTPQTVTLHQEM